ncbi:GTP-binding protein [Candidatus Woesearchaeota archaeon]|nr:GTP-binding protein [Candidatus Woesearchaeota archaeon]
MVEYNTEIKELEREIAETKYNKRTQRAIGLMKAKLARLKEKEEARGSKKSGAGDGYQVRKTGDGTVILLGFPSVGKSTLLNSLTNAESEVGHYAFTTLTVIPGLLDYNHAKIQVLDVPGVVRGAALGTGRGKEVLACMRSADLCLFVIDAQYPEHLRILQKEVYNTGIRLNRQKPDVKIKKRARDGLSIASTCRLTRLDSETIASICKEFKINNADIVIRDNIGPDEFIDIIQDNKIYMKSIVVINKIDLVSEERLKQLVRKIRPDLCISAKEKQHTEELKELVFNSLDLIRIYMKEPRKPADMDVPLIMPRGCTIKQVCEKLHKDFVKKFRFARVSGPSSKFKDQVFKLPHVLKDSDVLELHIK